MDTIGPLREKLLDLSLKNKLLSMRFARNGAIRVVDELPDVIFQTLASGSDGFTFEPLPDATKSEVDKYWLNHPVPEGADPKKPPTETAWARYQKISPDYDLPPDTAARRASKHVDKRLQTLQWRERLEAVIKKLASDARAAVEETGSNMLFMGIGFLEWSDDRAANSDGKVHLAPLLLVPVRLQRLDVRAGPRGYRLESNREDVQENLALRLKLDRDFGLRLPDFDAETGVESFFEAVGKAVQSKPNWKVRRQAFLGLVPQLGRLLLYNDLDPANWYNGKGITQHPLVGRLLGTGDKPAGISFEDSTQVSAETYAKELELPIVDRLDSSQTEALRLALEGQSLVIQGPPGTGKSQTITNIIAAMLSTGRSVLFVAEKLAAIEVVKRRLDALGLGEFCLELHSNRTRKSSFLEVVEQRLKMRAPRKPRQMAALMAALRDQRKQLNDYTEKIGSTVERGLTADEVFYAAGRTALPLGPIATLLLEQGIAGEIADRMPDSEVTAGPIDPRHDRLVTFAPILQLMLSNGSIADHPWYGLEATGLLADDIPKIKAALSDWALVVERVDSIARDVDGAEASSTRTWAYIDQLFSAQSDLALLNEIMPDLDRAAALARQVEQAGLTLPPGAQGLAAIRLFAELLKSAPDELYVHVHAALFEKGVCETLTTASSVADRLSAEHAFLRDRLPGVVADDVRSDDLRQAAVVLRDTGILERLFGEDWRRSRALVRRLGGSWKVAKPAEWADLLQRGIRYRQDRRAFSTDEAVMRLVRATTVDIDYAFNTLIAIARWSEQVCGRVSAASRPIAERFILAGESAHQSIMSAAEDPCLQRLAPFLKRLREDRTQPNSSLKLAALELLAPAFARERLRSSGGETHLPMLLDQLRQLDTAVDDEERAATKACALLQAPFDRFKRPTPTETATCLRQAIGHVSRVIEWTHYARARKAATDTVTAPLIEFAERGGVSPTLLPEAWDFVRKRAAARRLYRSDSAFETTQGASMTALREAFRQTDGDVMDARRLDIAARLGAVPIPEGRRGTRASDYTERALLDREIGKKTAHRPIREVTRRAGQALRAMKPCFMMGPLSVAQYIAPNTLAFDVVIMDEASQMRPEEALSAVARGKQLIVVGDDKQLPPTPFFQRFGGDDAEEDEDEVVAGQQEESILRLASQCFQSRMLLWHYRSRNEALIAFSNQSFYRNSLIIFPTPNAIPDHTGIDFRFVQGASFKDGVNDVEARAVATAAADHLRRDPGRSLIVVAMNIRQKDRIRHHFQELTKGDPFFAREEEADARLEPFDIKNLENVQGDERDVVMISMTYGPDPTSGRVLQRFGPINGEYGHRRLNVLFSRARDKMVVFSSMRHSDINVGEASAQGVTALQNFLAYAETKILRTGSAPVGSGRDPDSDFEIAVTEALQSYGYACVAQLGVAGFFLDIAVRDPDQPGSFLMGIECDGASYHSTRSARDRDRLRQDVLEHLGWTIERVWSTDWFHNPQAEIQRLVQALEETRATARTRRTRLAATKVTPPQIVELDLERKDAPDPGLTPDAGQQGPSGISREEARALLVELRTTVEEQFPDTEPSRRLLRQSMIDALVRYVPTDVDQWRANIPLSLRDRTSPEEFTAFRGRVFSVLESVVQ